MDTNGSGVHHQVQAAAGRAVGGGQPLSATAAAAASSSLPPPAPSAPDAAVQPRARHDSPDNHPRANPTGSAGERSSDNEENNSRFFNIVLPPLTSYAGAGATAATQIGVTLERMDEEDAPIPPAQIVADFERMDAAVNGLKKTSADIEDVRMHPLKIATDFDDIVKQEETLQQVQDPPTPVVAWAPSPTPIGFENMDAASLQRTRERVRHQQEEILQRAQGPPTPAKASLNRTRRRVRRQQERILQKAHGSNTPAKEDPQHPSTNPSAPSPPPTDQGRSPSNTRGQQQFPVRPPPPSMMPSPDEDADTPVLALPLDSSVRVLNASVVEDQPEIPVYDAVQVAEQTRLEKNKKITIGLGVGLLIGAVAAGVSVSSNNGSSDSNTIVPEGVVLSTALTSESPSSSQFPSLHPTLGPSQSTNPSQSPSRSVRPSLSPSISASPTPFCFSGEINILTDTFPDETSWRISRIDNADGVANSKVVLEGFPELEDYHTSDKLCLERGDYEFAIFDSGGDGIFRPGYYNVTFEETVIAQGGRFESEERVYFSLPIPSPPPSESSSPSQFPSASFQPSESIIPSRTLSPSLQPSNSFSPSTYWSSLDWNRQGLSLIGDASDDRFGRAVALSADASTMAIGAPGPFGRNDRPGYVKVYQREGEGSSWEQRGETIHGEANGDNFGHSLSLSEDGTALSIGAPFRDSVGPKSGQVIIYEWDRVALDYVQIGDALYGASSYDEFGWSLDISNGKILAIGAKLSDANGFDSGQVMIYAWDNASSKYKQRGAAIDGDAANNLFGYSVSLSGDGQKLAIGAIYADSNGLNSGQVRVFDWDETTSNYVQLGDSFVGDVGYDKLGSSVSFSRDGTTLAVGASGGSSEKYPVGSGQVKVFAWNETASSFEQIGQSLYGKEARDEFGSSVALSSAGKTLAIRACQALEAESGYVEVYEWDEAVSEYKRLGQRLGVQPACWPETRPLALSGNGKVLAVGSPLNDRNGADSGRVEVFDVEL